MHFCIAVVIGRRVVVLLLLVACARRTTSAPATVVKHGFARGTEPVAYVDQIVQRWSNYKEFVKEPEAIALPAPAVPQPPS